MLKPFSLHTHSWNKLEVFSEDIPHAGLWYNLWNKMALSCNHFWFNISYLVHGLCGVWCLFQGWDVGTLGNTHSGCVTQDPRVGPSETCAIHTTHPVVSCPDPFRKN